MILSVGTRTDIVNHYGDWLMERFREGYVYQRNPLFPNRVNSYLLAPDKIDAIYFCSKNYAPFLGNAAKLAREYRTMFHYTITGYGADLEPNIPPAEEGIRTLLTLASIVGAEKVVWRYDPVLLTENYTAERHFETFERIAAALSGKIGRCIFGFVEAHHALRDAVAGLVSITMQAEEQMAAKFAEIARKYGFVPQMCRSLPKYEKYGIDTRGCVRLDLLGRANGCAFRDVKHKGNRRRCLCIESRDVGAYDTCPNLCRYCYANTNAELVRANMAQHDVHSPLLIGTLKPTDILMQGLQERYLKDDGGQLSLF